MTYADDEHFTAVTFSPEAPPPMRNEGCVFEDCDFTAVVLRDVRFVDCRFIRCDFTNCNVVGAAFQQVEMQACKAMGVRWDTCSPFLFELHAHESVLDYCCWAGVDLSRSRFAGGSMREADFSEVQGEGMRLTGVDVTGARWERCRLKGATFEDAKGLELDVSLNAVRGMRVDRASLPGLVLPWGVEVTD